MKIFDNPDAMLKSKFGQYQIAVLGNIVAVSAEGTASKSAIARYSQDMIDVITSFNGERWAFLGLLHGSALLTNDAEVELQKSIEWRAKHGMAMGALVTGETTVESMVKMQFERIYKNAEVQLGIFGCEESALSWLSEKGFSPTVNSD
ncbi:hypothetical protein DRW07_05720 [Alteromonas sediminis]|uniref:STAS/SEC14 domain-containing protein n=1 Tax=Alteromonas sediminis TaxID=2259342 RepID=A0A3N5Y0P0_9ALTE|nr:hypothetical protein [Alteromonas sediminis]RPJ67042.1 hypothetical protein DRW07_05720 [Alteromonas sediminis]